MKLTKTTFTFDQASTPICHAQSGDILTFVTRDCYDNQVIAETDTLTIDWDRTNPATGPVYVEGAHPGDVIVVDILDITLSDTAVAAALPDCGPENIKTDGEKAFFAIRDGYLCWAGKDIRFPVDPMIGVIGLADTKPVSTGYAGRHGGNMDSRIIGKGTSVYLPVRVEGGYLCMGDLHAVMADGEMAGNGAEVSGEIVCRVRLKKDVLLNYPVTETKDCYFVNTCGDTCDEAIRRGYTEMHRLIRKAYHLNATEAAIYMSLQGRLESNQSCLTDGAGGNTFRTGTPKRPGKPLF